MSDMKQVEGDANPTALLTSVENTGRREDAFAVMRMMDDVTGLPPRVWGKSMVGFGSYAYSRKDGSQHRYFRTGFAPRKANLTIYIMPGFKNYGDLLERLGKHKHSVSCLYLGRLKGIDMGVLEELVRQSMVDMARIYPE